jgi:hypothetical protein
MRPLRQIEEKVVGKGRVFLCLAMFVATALGVGCTGTVKSPNGQTALPTSNGQTFTISGAINPVPSSGATVALSGAASATTTSSSSGAYSFTGLSAGTYAVTPSGTGFAFNPTTQSAIIVASDITGLNFVSTAQTGATFTLSGTITPTAAGTGAALVLSGPVGATATANSSGNYSFPGLTDGTYSVTPTKSGFAFTPATQTATISDANKTGVNFTGVASSGQAHLVSLQWNASTSTVTGYNVYRSTVSGSGFVKLNAALLTSLSYSDSSVSSGNTYFYVATAVDSAGDESVDSNQAVAVVP